MIFLGMLLCTSSVHMFRNVVIRDARHNTDQCLVMGCLRGDAPAAHSHYPEKRTRLPIRPPATPDRIYHMFAKLRRAIPRPPRRERHHQILTFPETWSLIDIRIEAHRRKDQNISRALIHTIMAGIQEDRRRRAAGAGSMVEYLLASYPSLI